MTWIYTHTVTLVFRCISIDVFNGIVWVYLSPIALVVCAVVSLFGVYLNKVLKKRGEKNGDNRSSLARFSCFAVISLYFNDFYIVIVE